jgi:drug/metabolite transporter (DMT)-like permease
MAVLCFIGGSIFLAFRVEVRTLPPLLCVGVGGLLGAVLTSLIQVLRGEFKAIFDVNRREVVSSLIVGALIYGGAAMVLAGEKTVPSGVAALVASSVPLVILVMRMLLRDRVPSTSLVAAITGFVGIAILFLPGKQTGEATAIGIVLVVVAAITSGAASMGISRMRVPDDSFTATIYFMLFGGSIMLLIGILSGELASFRIENVSTESWVAGGYLIIAADVVALSLYTWLLKNAPVSVVTSTAYIDPVIAVSLGAIVLGEAVTALTLIAATIIVVSVAFIVRAENRAASE